MSCLLQHPGIPFHYSQSPASSSVGLVMESKNCYPYDTRESLVHPSLISQEQQDPFGRSTARRGSDSYKLICQHPEIFDSRNEGSCFDEGNDNPVKNEPFYPQRNSPVDFFKTEPSWTQNGFQNSPTSHTHFIEELNARMLPSSPTPKNNPSSGTTVHDIFNLKLELENYLQSNQSGDQFRNFRGQVSPASSLSCSSSSLLSLSLAPPPSGSPPRRHSFSAAVSNAQSLSSLNSHLVASGNCTSGGLVSGGGNSGTPNTAGYYRQRSYTYSTSCSKGHPYPMNKRLGGWSASSQTQGDPRDHIHLEGLRIRPLSSMSDEKPHEEQDHQHPGEKGRDEDEEKLGSSDGSRDNSRKGSIDEKTDSQNFMFLGPFGKKRKMVRERQQSGDSVEMHIALPGSEEQSPEVAVASPEESDLGGAAKDKVEDIVEEDETEESIEVCEEEPLNLCLCDEADTVERVRQLNINCSSASTTSLTPQPTLSPAMNSRSLVATNLRSPSEGSVLRNHLLGLNTLGPTPAAYQTRDRCASMSVVTLGKRLSVIQETRQSLSLNTRPVISPPPDIQHEMGVSQAHMNGCDRKILQCGDCGKTFSQLRNFRYHRSRHEGTSQFACTCPVCGKQFNDKGYLSSHLKIHRNMKEYQCEYCEKSFNQRVAYNMHVRIHTGHKPHKCSLCVKAFSRKMLLRQHLRTHTGEKPYPCEVCGKAFADRSNMLLHQRLHSGARPYSCDQCGKSFSKNHHLKTHLNHHAGIKPYQCTKCMACFSQSSNMKTHYRKCTGGSSVPEASGPASATTADVDTPSKSINEQPHSTGTTYTQAPVRVPESNDEGASSYFSPQHSNQYRLQEGLTPSSSVKFRDQSPFYGNENERQGFQHQQTPPVQIRNDFPRGHTGFGQPHGPVRLGMSSVRSPSPPPNSFSYRRDSTSLTQPAQYHSQSHQMDPSANILYAAGHGPSHPYTYSLLGPAPSAASLPLNFELHTLRNRSLGFPPLSPQDQPQRNLLQHRQHSPQNLQPQQQHDEMRQRANTYDTSWASSRFSRKRGHPPQ